MKVLPKKFPVFKDVLLIFCITKNPHKLIENTRIKIKTAEKENNRIKFKLAIDTATYFVKLELFQILKTLIS